jgi:outer membrane receptor for ferrienterochelin and colicins
MTRTTPRAPWRALLLLALSLFAALPARAQAGAEIRGTVAGPDGRAVPNAQVVAVGTRRMAVTNQLGAFALARVPAGTYQLRVSAPGFRTGTQAVTVRDGEPAMAAVALVTDPVQLDGVVVSASRRSERITDAPATITHIGSDVLENSVGNSFAGALKNVKGLDFIQTGMTTVAINARGFNSSFNNRMLMLEDGRISVLPENGLPVGQLTATPKVDLAGMEVLVGPGSSLYGPDASNGVLALTTKDPRQYPGLTVEASGGTRQYADL